MVEPTADVEVSSVSAAVEQEKTVNQSAKSSKMEEPEKPSSPTTKANKKIIKKSDAQPTRSSGRARSTTTRFDPSSKKISSVEEPQISEADALKYGYGDGTPLGEIPRVAKVINKTPAGDALLIATHRLLFITEGTNSTRKKHLKKFSGFVWGENFTKEMAAARLKDKKWTATMLGNLCHLLDVPLIEGKQEKTEQILEFLEKPKEIEHSNEASEEEKGAKKRKRVAKPKKTTAKPAKKVKKAKSSEDDENEDEEENLDEQDAEDEQDANESQ